MAHVYDEDAMNALVGGMEPACHVKVTVVR